MPIRLPADRNVPLANRSRGSVRPSPRAARAHWVLPFATEREPAPRSGFEPAHPLPAGDCWPSRHRLRPRAAQRTGTSARCPGKPAPDGTRTAPGMRWPGAAHPPCTRRHLCLPPQPTRQPDAPGLSARSCSTAAQALKRLGRRLSSRATCSLATAVGRPTAKAGLKRVGIGLSVPSVRLTPDGGSK